MPPRLPIPPFVFPTLPSTWYIGHMSRAMREMQLMIQAQKVDLVIETRDARMPLTSTNPAFEQLLNSAGGRGAGIAKRLIVYNKADLAQECFEEPLARALKKHGEQDVIFTDSRSDSEVKRLLKTAIKMADRELDGPEDRISMLIAGMPNVGKSSILNSLRRVGVRKGKAASTSSMPGHTRRLSTVIKISEKPPVYIYDTPGIMVPFLGRGTKGNEAALKLALTGGIKESLFEGDTVSEYLLWRLRMRCEMREEGYTEEDLFKALALPPGTPLDSPSLFLEALAKRLSAMRKGGEPDTDFAGRWLIQAFREGKLGRWTLDSMGRGGEAVDVQEEFELAEEEGRVPRAVEWSYLSGEKQVASSSAEAESTPLNDTISPSASSTTPLATTINAAVDEAVSSYLAIQSAPTIADLSGHQAKKQEKADQARIRDIKRKSRAVASVKGPGGGIQSARRRKYRRGG
ncbi:P-loop containing nucleoside triphosphate hydrolase protein [Leucosporidium creatinivorum]|uniref:p-loop containing nucleoside triphosphate hydrolase protein n=1 Tax=Leucosporidium creatinivorum TaxID=106004 RepID=A0A1Y2G3Z3_9BASI|nr:P-loop containing nucleoside triphosphate hydrolase protein [Leucosporidium creatinivorum]